MRYQRAEDRYRQPKNFRRIVIISGDNTRTYTFSPLLLFGGIVVFIGLSLGIVGSTFYLAMRDNLFQLAHARTAAMQVAYEDRIARLRSEIDKISSHQILDQVAIDDKLEELLATQKTIADRQSSVSRLIDKAAQIGLIDKSANRAGDDRRAEADPIVTGSTSAYADASAANRVNHVFDALMAPAAPAVAHLQPPKRAMLLDASGRPDFAALGRSLNEIGADQARTVETIAAAAEERTKQAMAVIDGLGADVDLPAASSDEEGVGGPFIPEGDASDGVSLTLGEALDQATNAFDRLSDVKKLAASLPLGEPMPGADITSTFGERRDPFLGVAAFHPGIDFRSPTGTDVRPTAAGTVISAGWAGGYGNMVEIDHGNGLSTRYGHLSKIAVTIGQKVGTTTVIGEVGSTGRSTGPHLHYETRINGKAVNPMNYIVAGSRLADLLG